MLVFGSAHLHLRHSWSYFSDAVVFLFYCNAQKSFVNLFKKQ